MKPVFQRIDMGSVPWKDLESYPDRLVYQTQPWLEVLAHVFGGEPVVAALQHRGDTVGWFTGLIVKKFGFKILGSPFRGWMTSYMGLNLKTDISRSDILRALSEFAFHDLRCHHLEILDRHLETKDYEEAGFQTEPYDSYEIDLRQSEDQLFANMTSPCRRCIRKASKSGVVVEEAHDMEFLDDYYEQFKHVVEFHGDVPIYGKDLVRAVMEYLMPADQVLLLRARNREGMCIATGIFVYFDHTMLAWGQASWRHLVHVRPNEAIHWYALKYWKDRGGTTFEFSGRGAYKKKYGCRPITIPRGHKSRNRGIAIMRNAAKKAFYTGKRALARLSTGGDRSGEARSGGNLPRIDTRGK